MLKVTLPYILNLLTDMFNRILSDGIYHSLWKTARVVPVFKTGDYNKNSTQELTKTRYQLDISNRTEKRLISNNTDRNHSHNGAWTNKLKFPSHARTAGCLDEF